MQGEISRNKEHELIMIALYDALTYVELTLVFPPEKIMEDVFRRPFEKISLFARTVFVKALKNIDAIITVFQKDMKTWRFQRLNRLEQALLIMSYAHHHYVEKVEKNVVIDVAVRLAKRYLDVDDYKFVNAILDKVL